MKKNISTVGAEKLTFKRSMLVNKYLSGYVEIINHRSHAKPLLVPFPYVLVFNVSSAKVWTYWDIRINFPYVEPKQAPRLVGSRSEKFWENPGVQNNVGKNSEKNPRKNSGTWKKFYKNSRALGKIKKNFRSWKK